MRPKGASRPTGEGVQRRCKRGRSRILAVVCEFPCDRNRETGSLSPVFLCHGEERTSTANGTDKFGTYFRDGYGQDYADQRYYTSNFGRFWSPDRGGTAKAGNPITWNKYGYASGDPVNRYDPAGRDDEDAGCATFDYSICEAFGDTDPMNTGVMPPPGDVSVPCADAYGLDYNPFPGVADCPMTPEQYDELVEGPPAPDCSLELEYTGVKSLLGVVNHAAIVLTDSYGYTITMEGFPQQTLPPWGNLVPQNAAGNAGYTQWGNTLTSSQDPSLCDQIGEIETAEIYYANHEVAYFGWGPNSNSFAHWLLQSGYVDQYFTQPPSTPGWNTPLYGTLWGVFPN